MSTIAKLVARAELNTSGFDKGVASMEKSVERLSRATHVNTVRMAAGFVKIGTTVLAVGKIIATGFAVTALVGLGLAVFALLLILSFATRSITAAFSQTKGNTSQAVSDIKNALVELQVAFANAFLPLITVALPYILNIINWLTRMLNLVAMIVAAWVGQKQVMQVVIGSVANATKAIDKMRKSAQGALADFDQLNVLQQPQDFASPAEALLAPGVAATEMIDVTDDILQRVQAIKDIIAAWWADPLGMAEKALHAIWEYIIVKAKEFSAWFDSLSTPWKIFLVVIALLVVALIFLAVIFGIASLAISIWTGILAIAAAVMAVVTSPITLVVLVVMLLIAAIVALIIWWPVLSAAATAAVEKIQMAWANLVAWFENTVINPLIAKVSPWWNFISIVAHDALVLIKYAWQTVTGWFSTNVTNPLKLLFLLAFGVIEGYVTAVWAKIKLVFGTVKEWLSANIGDPIRSAFGSALDWVHAKWNAIFASIVTMTKNHINGIIDLLNGMLRGMVSLLNGLIDGANIFGSALPEWISIPNIATPSIPHLAEGGVIPANSEFAAILGDQTSGNNIEAPEDLIRQIVREETGKMQADIKIEFGGSLAALVRELKPYIDKENVRVGGSLIKSGVTTS